MGGQQCENRCIRLRKPLYTFAKTAVQEAEDATEEAATLRLLIHLYNFRRDLHFKRFRP